jgi:hypothetical protein
MTSLRCTTLVALVAAALLALTGVAQAAPAGKGNRTATFKATLSGSQVTTWEYHHEKVKDDPCDASSHGYGDQTISFDAKRKFQIQFIQPPKGQADLFGTGGRPSVFTTPLFLSVDARVERNGDYSVNYGEVDKNNCQGGVGGGDGGPPAGKDCGVRDGRFNANLYFRDPHHDSGIPSPKPLPEKNFLKLEGSNYEWLGGQSGFSGATLDFVYLNCPMLVPGAYVERAGNIFTSGAKISEKKLLRGKQRKIVVSGHEIHERVEGDHKWKTIIAWNLRLTRVKNAPVPGAGGI